MCVCGGGGGTGQYADYYSLSWQTKIVVCMEVRGKEVRQKIRGVNI